MKRIRVALTGLGPRGTHWARVLHESNDTEVVAFCDPSDTALEAAVQAFGPHATFPTLEQALATLDGVDAVVIATPPMGRTGQIAAACDRRLPMLVEKPLALDLDEARALVQLAADASTPLMVGLNFRYLGVTIALKRLLDRQVLGAAEFAHFTYERFRDGRLARLNKYPLSMRHPMLWEQSIHHFDLLRHVYGRRVRSVYARTWNPSWSMYEGDTNVSAVFTFEGGFTVNYQGTWQANWQQPSFQWRTECTDGVIIQDDPFGSLRYGRREDPTLQPVPLPPHETWITDTAALYRSFLQAIADEAPWECTGRDHLESLEMVAACARSSAENRVIAVPAGSASSGGSPMGP